MTRVLFKHSRYVSCIFLAVLRSALAVSFLTLFALLAAYVADCCAAGRKVCRFSDRFPGQISDRWVCPSGCLSAMPHPLDSEVLYCTNYIITLPYIAHSIRIISVAERQWYVLFLLWYMLFLPIYTVYLLYLSNKYTEASEHTARAKQYILITVFLLPIPDIILNKLYFQQPLVHYPFNSPSSSNYNLFPFTLFIKSTYH